MANLLEALRKSGLVSKDKMKKATEKNRQDDYNTVVKNMHSATRKSRDTTNLERLKSATTVAEFKNVVKKLLLCDDSSEMLQEIIDITHKFRDNQTDGGRKLVWTMFKVRDDLKIIKRKYRKRYLNRALRKANQILDVPKNWCK